MMFVERKLEYLSINEKPVEAANQYTISVREYDYTNPVKNLGLTTEELIKLGEPKVVITSPQNVIEEYFSSNQLLDSYVEGRLVYK